MNTPATLLQSELHESPDERKFNSYLQEVKNRFPVQFSDLSYEAELCYSVYMEGYTVHEAVKELEEEAKERKKVVDINTGSVL